MATLNLQVEANADDGYVDHSTSAFVANGNTQWVGKAWTSIWGCFARFTVPSIPQGSTISSAYLKPTCDTFIGGTILDTDIYAEDVDDASAPTTYAQFTGVAKTAARVAWNSVLLWYVNIEYQSPNIASVIQEIVNRPGWSPGQHICLFWNDDGGSPHIFWYRRAFAHNQDPTKAMKLEITYTAPAACYALTRAHTGSGSDPTAAPTYSDGCVLGSYHAGEVITMTSLPAAGWYLASWTGTDGAQSNILTMPAAARTVTANYLEIPEECYALTRAHTGSGSDPTAVPANSDGCDAGQYLANETITMTSLPAAGWYLDSWTGTNGAQSNILTMPAATRTVTANYVELPRPWGAPIFF